MEHIGREHHAPRLANGLVDGEDEKGVAGGEKKMRARRLVCRQKAKEQEDDMEEQRKTRSMLCHTRRSEVNILTLTSFLACVLEFQNLHD